MIKQKLFTLDDLNQFYETNIAIYDQRNETESPKNRLRNGSIVAHAAEVRDFLRYLIVFLLAMKIPRSQPCYAACILLNELCNYIFAPKLSKDQALHFDVLYDEYIGLRSEITDEPESAKHHLARHAGQQVEK